MIQSREFPLPPPYSGMRSSSETDPRYDEEAAYDLIDYRTEVDRRNIIQPGFTETFYRGFARRMCFVFCILTVMSVTPTVVILILMTQYKF
ncbi:hypothetical protein BBP40_011668 [Aspergillus hancockii]|nr:hypothetical protein BBP40_011668 [Aspergillus hancockii]